MSKIEVELLESMGSDKSIAHSAWTSSLDLEKKSLRGDDDIKRVVNLLADSKHSVPFESVVFRFWMRIPISTDRQIMTHRIASHSGMSGRYRTMPTDYIAVPNDVMDVYKKVYETRELEYRDKYSRICDEANKFYNEEVQLMKKLQRKGVITNAEFKRVREFVRNVLPQGNMTERVSVMNLRSFANFYKLRSKSDAQPEIREVAELMFKSVKDANICPIAIEALERNNWII